MSFRKYCAFGAGFLAPYLLAGGLYAQPLVEEHDERGFRADFSGYESRGKGKTFLMRKTAAIGVDSELLCKERRGCAYKLIAPNGKTFAWMEMDPNGLLVQTLVDEDCAGGPFTKRYRGSDNFPVPECASAGPQNKE